MIFNLSEQHSIANRFITELRSTQIQKDRMRFRRNLERLGEVMAYELSKKLQYQPTEVETPLGIADSAEPIQNLVLATILRAGLPMHQGMLHYFDDADNAFISAYRKHHKDGTFEINVEYVSCPDIEGKVLVIIDPMLATGASMALAAEAMLRYGQPESVHFVTAIASTYGVDYIRRLFPEAYIWMGALDEELTAKSYIVPGLGDAGDLSYGPKLQE
ncbi:MAG TPA: uracil phosphoribosyltransferase [Saprospiraceae bacterium]|nr:uracil phosphoribosyltransferase [Saprospiraceae bacterium]HMP23711.1 uracil phosphoribosyltransferase [Saprospiraceae bacterium]